MKNLIPLFFILIAVIISFAACELEETYSPQERMDAFLADLNAENWSDLKAHTHPDALRYEEADDAFWSGEFYTHGPFANLSVTGTTATFEDDAKTIIYKASLKEEAEDDYKIYKIDRNDTSIFFNIQE